jgi:hypothetical protein
MNIGFTRFAFSLLAVVAMLMNLILSHWISNSIFFPFFLKGIKHY